MYRGLAIGGPWDGQYINHSTNMLYVPTPDGEVIYRNGVRAAYQPNLSFRYLFVTRYWVPYSERIGARSLSSILDEIDAGYVNYVKGLKNEQV